MTLRIDTANEGARAVLRLVGRIQGENLGDLEQHIGGRHRTVVLDLEEVTLVDLEVVRFLVRAEATGVALRHCPPFVREWIDRERDAAT